MVAYKTLVHTYIALAHWTIQSNRQMLSSYSPRLRCSASAIRCSSCFSPILSPNPRLAISSRRASLRYYSLGEGALAMENAECNDLSTSNGFSLGDQEDLAKDTVERLLLSRDDVGRLMMMERQTVANPGAKQATRWFPYVDIFKAGNHSLSSSEVLEALDPYISEVRKDRFRNVVKNRSYSLCLVVEGLTDFGNVSAAFRSADALGIQSVHVVSHDSSKRYRDNRHVSMGAEKWLDIEIWNSTEECFKTLKSRGYRVATTHVGLDAVSVYDMNWTQPTAIVVGNENRGISSVALQFSDLHCSIPMKGMVDSFNVSVAAGILMHHAVCDRISRTGRHGDLTLEESQILLAEFSLRHNKNTTSIAHEYATRRTERAMPKL